MAYVYRHIRLDKNVPFYIGIGGEDGFKRANDKIRRSNWWKNVVSVNEYRVEIMLDGLSYEDAKKKEIEFISLYGRVDLKTGTLINQTNGGDGTVGRIMKQSAKDALILSKIGNKNGVGKRSKEFCDNLGLRQRGKIVSAETRKKIGESSKNRIVVSNSTIIAYLNGREIGRYDKIKTVAKELHLQNQLICKVIKGYRKHTRGFTFKRIDNGIFNAG